MSNQSESKHIATEPAPIGCFGLVVRMIWLLAGNAVLFLLAILIFQKRVFSILDAGFWAVVASLVLLRYMDITRLKGLTSDSEPATLKHWRVYAIRLIVASAVLWGLAHGIPYLIEH
ncbi:MAG: hypothetical protein NTW97_01320 [Candidatus Krumholzibacteria bacterium]|nr:hypothetical protein [Candidatus Krumholzibacteria bacterium]